MTELYLNQALEPYLTIPDAARKLGVPASTLRRAVNSGLLRHHTPFSSRRRILLSEVREDIAGYGQERDDFLPSVTPPHITSCSKEEQNDV